MASKRITVFGGSGFLGRQFVKSLAAEGVSIRVAVRHPERASFRGWVIKISEQTNWLRRP